MQDLQVNDIGTEIQITVKDKQNNVVDLSSATSVEIHCTPPNDSSVRVFSTSFITDGSDGNIYYIIQDGDIDIVGTWEVQVIVYFNSNLFHSNIFKVKVLRNVGV